MSAFGTLLAGSLTVGGAHADDGTTTAAPIVLAPGYSALNIPHRKLVAISYRRSKPPPTQPISIPMRRVARYTHFTISTSPC